jgi:hypothetical protein
MFPAHASRAEPKGALSIQRKLAIARRGQPPQVLDLHEVMKVLHIPSASVAVIDGGNIAWSRTFGVNSGNSPRLSGSVDVQIRGCRGGDEARRRRYSVTRRAG